MKKLLLLLTAAAASAWAQNTACNGNAAITITTSGLTTVIAGNAANNIHVCKVSFASSTGVDVTFVGVNGGGNTNITGTYKNVSSFVVDFGGDLKAGLGNGLGINISGAATVGGVVTYYLSSY